MCVSLGWSNGDWHLNVGAFKEFIPSRRGYGYSCLSPDKTVWALTSPRLS